MVQVVPAAADAPPTVHRAAAPERETVSALVTRAADGDSAAWDALVERFAGLVWHIARAHRLDAADASDVSQTVWLRLVENLPRLREPEALAGWLSTTARNESLRVLRRAGRETPDDDRVGSVLADLPGAEPGPESVTLQNERHALVWQGLATLSGKCQQLLRALCAAPEYSYAEVSSALGMPIGSIGPTRSRCLDNLRKALVGLGLAGPAD